jgi:outer membrane protein TolC
MHIRSIIALLLTFFLFTDSKAQQQKDSVITLDLSKAIEMALANAPDMRRALLSVKDADQLENLAWAEVLPTISSDLGYTRNMEIPVNFVPGEFFGGEPGTLVPIAFGTDNSWDGGFTVRQTLFRGQAFIGISTSTVFRLAQLENFRATSQQVVTQIRQAYYAVLLSKQQLDLQRASLERLKANLDDNVARSKSGIIDEYEVLRLQVQVKNEEPKVLQVENQLSEALRNVKIIIGLPLDTPLDLLGDLSSFDILTTESSSEANTSILEITNRTPFSPVLTSSEIVDLDKFRGDLRVLDYQIQLKKKEIAAEKSVYLPNISATYNLRWSAAQSGRPIFFGESDTRARFQTLGLSASMPLFDGMRRNVNVQRAVIARKDLEVQYEFLDQRAKNELITTTEDILQIFEILPSTKDGVDLARKGYERALSRFNNGIGSQLDVTEAELQLRQAELNLATLVYQYLSSKANYDQALGRVPFVSN